MKWAFEKFDLSWGVMLAWVAIAFLCAVLILIILIAKYVQEQKQYKICFDQNSPDSTKIIDNLSEISKNEEV